MTKCDNDEFIMKTCGTRINGYSQLLEEIVTCNKHRECLTILEGECVKM